MWQRFSNACISPAVPCCRVLYKQKNTRQNDKKKICNACFFPAVCFCARATAAQV